MSRHIYLIVHESVWQWILGFSLRWHCDRIGPRVLCDFGRDAWFFKKLDNLSAGDVRVA